jgi:hypothetical protein
MIRSVLAVATVTAIAWRVCRHSPRESDKSTRGPDEGPGRRKAAIAGHQAKKRTRRPVFGQRYRNGARVGIDQVTDRPRLLRFFHEGRSRAFVCVIVSHYSKPGSLPR